MLESRVVQKWFANVTLADTKLSTGCSFDVFCVFDTGHPNCMQVQEEEKSTRTDQKTSMLQQTNKCLGNFFHAYLGV